jgi:imidazolonepropionase-like amidohydrolase
MLNESSGGVVVLSLFLIKGAFMRNRLFFVVGLIAPALLLTCPVRLPAQAKVPVAGPSWALVGGTVYVSPTEPPIRNAIILIRSGTIAAVGRRGSVQLPAQIQKLDCSGLTITAGLWNSHVHFVQRKWANVQTIPPAEISEQMADMVTRWGFTSVFDIGSAWENTRRLRDRIESGEISGPRIRSTGEILFPKGGAPELRILDVVGTMRIQFPEVAEPAEATAQAKKLLDSGVDGIKVYAASLGSPTVLLPQGAIDAAAHEAHARGKPVFAHPHTREGLMAAVHGGADILAHSIPNAGQLDDGTLTEMKNKGVAIIPTLKLWRYELRNERTSQRQQFVKAGVDQLRSWVTAGGTVLFGTDVGYMDDYDTAEEYDLMAQAGMDARQILTSLTTAPAERFGDSGRVGRIVQSLAADLVILDKDPSEDVRAFAAVRYTIRDGKVIYPTNLTQGTPRK